MEHGQHDTSKDERLRELIEEGAREGHSVGGEWLKAREGAEPSRHEAKAQVYEVRVRLTVREGKGPDDVPILDEVRTAVARSGQVLADELKLRLSRDYGREVESVSTTAPAVERVELAQ